MTWLWQPLLPGAAQLLAAGVVNYELNVDLGTYSISGQNPDLVPAAVLSVDTGVYSISGQDPALVPALVLDVDTGAYVVSGQDPDLFEGAEPVEPEPEEPSSSGNGVSGGTYKKPKKKKRKQRTDYDDGGFGGVLAPMEEEGGAVVPSHATTPVADASPAAGVPSIAAAQLGAVPTLADRLGQIDYAAQRAARAKRLEEIEDEEFLLLAAA